MNTQKLVMTRKKSTNLSINSSLLNEAKSLKINVSYSAEQGISLAIKERKRVMWLEENAQAIESSNRYATHWILILIIEFVALIFDDVFITSLIRHKNGIQ